MQVHYDEGVAIHIGPEPCTGVREDVGEASVGERAGQPLSHDSFHILGADVVAMTEGNTAGRVIASAPAAQRGRRTWHARKLFCAGTGRSLVWPVAARTGPCREGEEP